MCAWKIGKVLGQEKVKIKEMKNSNKGTLLYLLPGNYVNVSIKQGLRQAIRTTYQGILNSHKP